MLAETIAKAQPDRALRIRELLRCIWRGDENADDYLKILLSGSRMRFNWRRGELEYAPENELEEAVYALFRNSSLAKVCENPECPAKYFIAQRKSQRYCGEECASVYQREWKRKWWKKKGAKLRSEQRRQKEKRKGDGN